jgi:hypothetical protein
MRFWLLFGLIFYSFLSFSQRREWGIEVNPKLGFLLAHRGVMGHLPREHAIGGEISYFISTNGSKRYHQSYNYPKVGLTLFGSTVGNNKILGQVFGMYTFIDFPLKKTNSFELSGRLGAGGSWSTKVFDQELNPKNVAMSTHINALICFGLRTRFYFGELKKTHILAGIDMTHCSNGSTKVPNLGINMPYISLGIGHTFNQVEKIKSTEKFVPKKWNLTAIGIISTKEVFPTGGKKYPIYAFSLVGKKIFSPKNGMELGLDLIYKTSINAYKPQIHKTKEGIAQIGLYCGYVLPLDKLQFVLGMGLYVRDQYFPDSRMYHRLGMRYQLTNKLLINFTLKTHWAKADYVEYGIGYTF